MSNATTYRRDLVRVSRPLTPFSRRLTFETRPIVFEHLSALLSASAQYSVLLIERAVVGLLRLCLILAQKVYLTMSHVSQVLLFSDRNFIQPSLRDQIYVSFDILSGLPTAVAAAVAEQIISGVILVVEKHRDIVRSATIHTPPHRLQLIVS